MKKSLIFFALFSLPLIAYQDLGIVGKTYNITESDVMEDMQEAAKKVNLAQLKLDILESVKESLIADSNLSFCTKNATRKRDISIYSKKDINIDEGDIHIPSGTKIAPIPQQHLSYIVLNIEEKEELEYIKSNNMPPFILVSKGDIRKTAPLGFKEQYILSQTLAEQLEIQCTPSIVSINGGILSIEEIYIKRGEKK